MKQVVIFFLLFAPVFIYPQEETLVETGEIESGGYGALSVDFSKIAGKSGVLVGGYGGWLINHTFLIGGGGYGLANHILAPQSVQSDPNNLLYVKLGYGGFMMEYIGNSQKLIHYTIQTLIGGGGASYALKDQFDVNEHKNSPFFVWELGVNGEINIVEYFRLCIGAKYRLISGVSITGLKSSDFSGITADISFKFGSF